MSSVANEISGKAFDTQDITPEFNQNANPAISQENKGQEGIADGNQQSEKSDEGIAETSDTFNSVAAEPTMDIYQQDLERYADAQEDSLENSHELSQQLDGNELNNEHSERNYDLDDGLSF